MIPSTPMTPGQAFTLAAQAQEQGDLATAEHICRQILAVLPNHVDSLHLLGLLRHRQGDTDEGIGLLRQTLNFDPENPTVLNNLGVLLAAASRREEAVEAFRQSLHQSPEQADTLSNLGNLCMELGRLDEAEKYLKAALCLAPLHQNALFNAALLTRHRVRPMEAYALLRKADGAVPGQLRVRLLLASVQMTLGHHDEAQTLLQKLRHQHKEHAEVRQTMARCLEETGRPDQALALLAPELATEACTENAPALAIAGLAYFYLGDAQTGGKLLQTARAFRPDDHEIAEALANYCLDHGDFEQAATEFNLLLERRGDPLHQFNRGVALLRKGTYQQGLADYEARWTAQARRGIPRPIDFPEERLWKEGTIKGQRLVIWAEQGLGDMLQAARYIPLLADLGTHLQVLIRPHLRQLFALSFGKIAKIVDRKSDIEEWDIHCPMMSLPLLMKSFDDASIPAGVPYLSPDPAAVDDWQKRLAGMPEHTVGIVWETGEKGTGYTNEQRRRSMPAHLLAPLFEVTGVRFVNLQVGSGRGDLAAAGLPAENWTDGMRHFADAAVVANLDLVITVDTAMGHLAGALARPVWVMLPVGSGNFFFDKRTDNPWYPTMRLFRQPTYGAWEPVIQEVKAALEELVRQRRG